MKKRAIFLDRDGVINQVILREGKPFSRRRLDQFVLNDGIRETVHQLKGNGFKIIVVSNQPDLARGEITEDILNSMTERLKSEIQIDDIYICPHDDHHHCSRRKPRPGMLLQAAQKWDIDLTESFLIGDTWKDMEAGKACGCKTILLDASYNQEAHGDLRVKSPSEAVSIILEKSKPIQN